MKVAVLGAGVVGVATAYYLARDGHEVTVIDREAEPASGASYANAGLIVPGHAYAWASPRAPFTLLKSVVRRDQALRLRLRADPRMWGFLLRFLGQCTPARARRNTVRKLGLCLYSRDALHEIVAASGVEYDGARKGILYLHRRGTSLDVAIERARILQENGVPLEVLGPDSVVRREPALAAAVAGIAGALYSPHDETGDCRQFTRALLEHCRNRFGVRLMAGTVIRGLEADGDRIARVRTDTKDVTADAYVLALGCWSPFVAQPLGIRLPIYPVKGYSTTFPVGRRNAAPAIGGVDEERLVAWSRLGDRMRLTATAEIAGYGCGHKLRDFRPIFDTARTLFPGACDLERPEYWAGLRPMTAEGTPRLGRAGYRNLWLNTGHGNLGWTMGPGTARVIADLVAGREPDLDIEVFRVAA